MVSFLGSSFRTTIKSAVLFSSIFFLLNCDQNTDRSLSTHQSPSSSKNDAKPVVPSRELLVRGVYHDLLLDPHAVQNADQSAFLRDVLEGLTAYDPQGKLIPAVAESWKTEDNKTWFFVLREGAKWSTGEAVTAQDFVRSWQQLAQSQSQLKTYLAFLNVANAKKVLKGELPADKLGVEAIEDRILRIQLDKATPYLPHMLAHIALLPRYVQPSNQFVGNGAYRLLNQHANFIHLEKNPYYWAAQKVAFKRVDYQKLSENQSIETLDLVQQPKVIPDNTLYFPQNCTYFYEFNLRDPLLSKSAVRKAIVSMVSARDIVQQVAPKMRPTTHVLPDAMQMEQDSVWEPVVVEQVFEQYGVSEKQPLHLKITHDQQDIHPEVAQRIVRMLSQSDMLRVTAEPVPWQTLLEKRIKGDFQMIRSGWCADYHEPSAFLNVFYSHSPDNKMFYANPKVDELLEKTLSSMNETERYRLYAELGQLLQTENVVLPIFQYQTPIWLHGSLNGYQRENATGIIYSKDLFRKVNVN
ncbi:peptide ABC transporter substrate-binding protein [Pasteurella sp. 22655_41Tandhals]|uniref:peptide ABC transporter substrate-binding protein n=1 Tax=Pasteurella sp. 22655_41Tandhals TaxID=3416655 RepID=UPI003CF47FD0